MAVYGSLNITELETTDSDTRIEKFCLFFEITLIFISFSSILWLLLKLGTRKFMGQSLRLFCINQCVADLMLLLLR